jgi:hypothetical protein
MAAKTPRWSLGNFFRPKKPPPLKPVARQVNPYHAVSILPGKGACPAAFRMSGIRFLSNSAPRLPLPSCDSAYCACRFKHHNDRRAGPRRLIERGLLPPTWSSGERRRSPGRRADDLK